MGLKEGVTWGLKMIRRSCEYMEKTCFKHGEGYLEENMEVRLGDMDKWVGVTGNDSKAKRRW